VIFLKYIAGPTTTERMDVSSFLRLNLSGQEKASTDPMPIGKGEGCKVVF